MSEYLNPADLAGVAGQRAVDRLFDEDGDGKADAGRMATVLGQACAAADALLIPGFPSAEVRARLFDPATGDELLRMHTAWLAMHFGARALSEWRDDQGRARYWQEYADAQAYLKALAKAEGVRSAAEATAGTNVQVGGNLNRDRPPPAPSFIFAGTPDKPAGSGGF